MLDQLALELSHLVQCRQGARLDLAQDILVGFEQRLELVELLHSLDSALPVCGLVFRKGFHVFALLCQLPYGC